MSFLNDNFIADFFILAIEWIYQFLREYSLTMIVVALFVRLVLLPVDVKQRANSRKMASINPEVESLRKRYANNPEQCNLRINKLYKERGISPMAGCLPMLLQLVFLLAFYGALRSIAAKETMSLVLRAAEHGAEGVQLTKWLWVHNLWAAGFRHGGCAAFGKRVFDFPADQHEYDYAADDGDPAEQRAHPL